MWKKRVPEDQAAKVLSEELARIERERVAWKRSFKGTLIGGSIASAGLLLLIQMAENWAEYEFAVRALARGRLRELENLRWSFDAGVTDAEAVAIVTTSVVLVATLNVALYAAALDPGRASIGIFVRARWSSTLSILAALASVIGVAVAATRLASSLSLGLVLLAFAALGVMAAASMVSTPDRRALLVKKADLERRLETVRRSGHRLASRFGETNTTRGVAILIVLRGLTSAGTGAIVAVLAIATPLIGVDLGAYPPMAWVSGAVRVWVPLTLALALVGSVFWLLVAADVASFGRDCRKLRLVLAAVFVLAAVGWATAVWFAFDSEPGALPRVIALEIGLLVWLMPAGTWVAGYLRHTGFVADFGRQLAREAFEAESELEVAIEKNDNAIREAQMRAS